MKQTNKVACFLTCVLVASSTIAAFMPPAFAIDTTVKVDPSQVTVQKNNLFTVNITLLNVSRLSGWEFKLYWNRAVLNCTQYEMHGPAAWGNNTYSPGPGVQNQYNGTHGRFWKATMLLRPAQVFNGSTTLVTFTFKALVTGASMLDLQDVKLADDTLPHPQPIAHLAFDGTVTVLPPPLSPLYMRSDQHTVNNATMYKLVENHTQTARSVNSSVTDPENEAYCYWGARVWKRSSVGAETELTSGSPVAVVSRTAIGSGLQSATWACPGTSLSVTDCLVVRVYYRFDWTNYTQCSQFITLRLNVTSLAASAWTVYYYTQRSHNISTHKTYMYYYWDNNYNSRTENICCN